jgi:hypothetical protein
MEKLRKHASGHHPRMQFDGQASGLHGWIAFGQGARFFE